MRVSIVVPSYNQAEFLEATLLSIIAQRSAGTDVELIVMDGGSTDGSVQVLQRYDAQIDHWVSEPDAGQADAINKGFERSTGGVMAWVNSDDVLLPGALDAATQAFESPDKPQLVFGDALWIDRAGGVLKTQREVGYDLPMLLWAYNYIPQPATFWTRSAWQRVGGIDTSYQCAFDYALWLGMIRAGACVRHLPTPLAGFRFYAEQKNQRLRAVSDDEDRRIVDAFLGRAVGRPERAARHAYHRARRAFARWSSGALAQRRLDRGRSIHDTLARISGGSAQEAA